MKLFHGEKLVSQNEYLANNKNLIYRGKKLLLISDKNFTEISLDNKDRFIFWGRIFAILRENGKSIPIDMKADGEKKLKTVFKKSKINEIIEKIEGDFVGCLLKKNGDVIVFCDSFNRKDIFYSFTRDGLIVSTDLSFLLSGEKKSYDQAAIANILMIYGMYAPKKHTIYKNVKRLGVGERIVLKNKTAKIEKVKFLHVKISDYDSKELEEYVKILEDAIRIRGSDSCNWIYLSSGWDSTILLALLVKIFGSSKVKAVTGKMVYSERAKNANRFEIERAKKFAEYYSVNFAVVPLDYYSKGSVKYWEKIKPFLRDNHIYGDNSCNFYYLSKYISKVGSPDDVVFCGEISDGAHNLGFSQFTTILEHPVLDFREYSDKMASYLFGPTFFKSILNGNYSQDAVYKLLRSRLVNHKFEDEKDLNEYEKKVKFITSFFLRPQRIPFYSIKNSQTLTDKGAELYDLEMVSTYLKEPAEKITSDTVYSWILHLYNSFHWQGSTVKSIPEVTSFNNLFLNLPFWDKRIQQFLSKMPENWGRGLELRPTKYPLKWMIANKIDYPKHLQVGPHSYLYDIDPNFSFKAELIYRSALQPYFQKTLMDYPFEAILDEKYFNVNYYKRLTDDYIKGVENSGKQLSDLYNLIWLCWVGWY